MTYTTTDVKNHVTATLADHFADEAFLVSAVTGGTAAIVTAGKHWERLPQFAATLREHGFIVADHSARGCLYVREPGPAHDVAMARETAAILARGYGEHVRLHGSPGTDQPATMVFDTGTGGGLTVEREGHLYDVFVTPRAEG